MNGHENRPVGHAIYHGDTSRAADLDTQLNSSDLEKSPNSSPGETKAADTEYEYITGIKLWLTMVAITLVCFLMTLDMSIIVTAIPRITTAFHSLTDVGWYGSAYLLANPAIQPLTGKLYSRFGTKAPFLTFLAVFELGSLLCGVAQSSKMLIIGRIVAGLGASGLTNGALTILAAAVPMPKRPAMMGIIMAVSQLGIAGGPLIGGVLTQYASWRWCFYINLPIGGICAAFLLMIKIPNRLEQAETKKATILLTLSQLDLVGFFIFAPSAIMFLLALEWGGINYAWNGVWEHRVGDEAMFPYSMVRKREVWSSCLVIGFFFGSLLTFSYYLPIYFQAVKGASPTMSGVYILPGILSQMLMAVVSGVLVGKLGYYLPWMAASGVIAAVGAGLISTFTPHTSTGKWIGYQPIVAIQNILPPEQIPVGMSLVAFCQTMGGTLFLTFAETIFSHGLVDGLRKYAPAVDFQAVTTAGATGFRNVVKPEEVLGVLKAYNLGIDRNFYLAAGGAAGTFLFCWGMGWHSVKKEKTVNPAA